MQSLSNFNILYINLDARTERRENIESQLRCLGLFGREGFVTQRISGVVGADLEIIDYAQSIADEFGVAIEKMTPEFWLSRKNFKTMSNNPKKVMGQVGCYLGHLRAIKYAIDNELKNVIILEDDCVLMTESGEDIVFPTPPENAEIFYLGGLFWHQKKRGETIAPLKTKKDHWLKINPTKLKIACAFAYGFANRDALSNVHTLLTNVWLEGKGKDKPRNWRTTEQRIRATAVDIMFVNFIQKMGEAYIISNPKTVQSDAFMSDVTDVGKKTPKKPYKHSYFYSS